jgi:hypothetical protein
MLIYIKIGSITSAQRAAALLREGGINALSKELENPQAGDGCGYMVGVNEKNFFKVKNILGRRGIKDIRVQNDDIS